MPIKTKLLFNYQYQRKYDKNKCTKHNFKMPLTIKSHYLLIKAAVIENNLLNR